MEIMEITELIISIVGAFIIAERFLLLRKINLVCDKYLQKGKVFKDKQTMLYHGRRNKTGRKK